MTFAALWSGGKDSALALARARNRGLDVRCLVNVIDAATDRVRFHATPRRVMEAQAAAVGLPLRTVRTSWERFDEDLRAAFADLTAEGVSGVVLGDIHLRDVRDWYEERTRAAGLAHVEPLWGEPPDRLLAEFVGSGGRALLTCVEVPPLDPSWLGRVVDERFAADVAALPIDPCGENGEYHSFAFAGPVFRRALEPIVGAVRVEGRFHQLDLRSV